eukprot:COSAG01_NODE_7746_length_3073_cov_145.308003_1_plen_169_part_00
MVKSRREWRIDATPRRRGQPASLDISDNDDLDVVRRADEEEENAVLSFSEAANLEPGRRGAFLPKALKSYAIQDHPLYEDAFEHLKEGHAESPSGGDEGGDVEAGEGGGGEGEPLVPTKPEGKPKRPTSASSSRVAPDAKGLGGRKLVPIETDDGGEDAQETEEGADS